MKKEKRKGLRTWIEVDKKAVKKNYQTFRGLIPKNCKLMAVVKSNAYGHGLADFSKEMEARGADFFGVDSAVEGLALREAGIKKPILVLGYTLSEMVAEASSKDLSLTISSLEQLSVLKKLKLPAGKPVKIHIKVDTGMHRQGFLFEDSKKLLSFLLHPKPYTLNSSVEGLFTHFASAKNPAFPAYTNHQIDDFKEWISAFKRAGFNPIVHASATAGTILFPSAHFNMARIGIGAYGLWPSEETRLFAENKMKLAPSLSWKTIISEIKTVKKGSKVGYDGVEILDKDSILGVCPVGYWHGLPRAFSSVGRVLVNGKFARIVGRVSMDMIVVDLTGIKNAKAGDEVVLIGKSGSAEISAYDFAKYADESHYEIITRINPLIKRIYI